MSGASNYYPSRFGRGVPALSNPSINAGLGGSQPMMGVTPRYNIRKNLERDPWDIGGDRMVQGGIDVNMSVDKELIKGRQANMNKEGMRTLGSVLNPDVLQIMESDLILIQRRSQTKGGAAMATKNNSVYATASLTGVLTNPSIFPSQEHFESSWYLVGKSKIAYEYGDTTQSQTGVSVMTAGATTISNVGTHTFVFGDRVRWRMFDIDTNLRRQQMHVVRRPKGHPPEKFVPILERATYEQMFKLTQMALDNYVRMFHVEGTAADREQFLSRNEDDIIVDSTTTTVDQHFKSECINSTAMDAVTIISTLMEIGLITVNLPSDVNDAAVANLKQFQGIDLTTLKSTNYGAARNGIPQIGGNRKENWEKTKILAHMLGVVPHSNVPVLTNLLDTLILRKYAGLLEGPSSRSVRKAASLVNIAEANTASGVNDGTGQNPIDRKLHLAQQNAAREADAHFYHMYRHATEQTFATSISVNSQPGSRVDVLL